MLIYDTLLHWVILKEFQIKRKHSMIEDISLRTLVSFCAILFCLISAVLILFANWQVVKKMQVAKSSDIFLKEFFFFCKEQTTHYLFNEKSNNDP